MRCKGSQVKGEGNSTVSRLVKNLIGFIILSHNGYVHVFNFGNVNVFFQTRNL